MSDGHIFLYDMAASRIRPQLVVEINAVLRLPGDETNFSFKVFQVLIQTFDTIID